MNWEKSKALTPLKRDFLLAFFTQEQRFFLTGGSALGIFYLGHRLSYDLDFFTMEALDWHLFRNFVRKIAKQIGAELTPETEAPMFHRFVLSRDAEKEVLDFVVEQVTQIDPQKERFSPVIVDTMREIAVNKICALIGRAEKKDLIDLFFLEKNGLDVLSLVKQARQKEGGVEPAILSWVVSQLHFADLPEYLLAHVTLDELNGFVEQLARKFASDSFPSEM